MIATYEERRATVRALQLTPETVEELCRWTSGRWSGWSIWFADRRGEHVIGVGDWVVQANGSGGGFQVVSADAFNDRYTAVVRR